jgi:hypothetical protein
MEIFADELAAPAKWAARLFATLKLPDKRLAKRLIEMVTTMAKKPADSIPQAFGNCGASKGAYRFIENERVGVEALQQPVADGAARNCAQRQVVLAVQDTTALSFAAARNATGLGPISTVPEAKGMLLHSTLALDRDGLPLGLLHQHQWCREQEQPGGKTAQRSLKEKESAKWLKGIAGARAALEANLTPAERPRLIHVFDREGDIHQVFELVTSSSDGAVIRSSHNRRVITEEGIGGYAHDAVRAAKRLGSVTIDVPRKPGQKARQATVETRACKVRLTPARSAKAPRRCLELTLVEIWEPHPPPGAAPLHWLLWTTEPVADHPEAMQIVGIYQKRWKIEEYHLILKSGCRVEGLQFETAERLAKVVALYAPIAVRILQLRDLSRLKPDAPCTLALTEKEWLALWTYIHQKPPPPGTPPPSLRQATLWIGRLGGHLGRKRDGMPGVRTLWRGWRDLEILTAMYCLIEKNPPPA